jgi:hypothetical protein
MRRAGAVAVAIVVAVSICAISASPALSSAACRRVKAGEVSDSNGKSYFYGCKEETETKNGWTETEGSGKEVSGEKGTLCYRVKSGQRSGWKNSTCTEANVSKGEYIKVEEGSGGESFRAEK